MHLRSEAKIILVIFFLLMIYVFFFKDSNYDEEYSEAGEIKEERIADDEEAYYNNFVILSKEYIGHGTLQIIMYDPHTKIMWTYINCNDGGGLSIIYNVDGTPVLYEK